MLIVLGIVLFLIEFLIIPGITIAGIGGMILTAAGIYLAYSNFGPQTGFYFLLGTLIVSLSLSSVFPSVPKPGKGQSCTPISKGR